MHLHPKHATALACLADPTLHPIDMNTLRFHGRVALDAAFAGMALSAAEGDRVAALLAPGKTVLLMANHGVLVTGATVAAAFDELYYFERAAETLLACYATGQPLRLVSDDVAALTARQWRDYGQLAGDHLEEVKAILDVEAPDYRD
jgi:ribulose-5-phosphate 4-epimerase/fuculose-1-phosphate aldolase